MLQTSSEWEKPDPAEVIHLDTDADWDNLRDSFSLANPTPWARCLEVARQSGARTVVCETRYIDIDYRSEYSAFFSRTFAEIPDTARRYHFFDDRLDPRAISKLPHDVTYLGYVVSRPTELGFVGRTMLTPPPDVAPFVTCLATEYIHFFGQRLQVSAMPFVQQDTQFGVCAHAAAWMCHYFLTLKGFTSRRTMGEIATLTDHSVGLGRAVPSGGLTGLQISNLMREFNVPPIVYGMDALPENPNDPTLDPGIRAVPVLCRYLNSGFPVLVGTTDHAFVVLGYKRIRRPRQGDWFHFVRHDDQRGPYRWIESIHGDYDPELEHTYQPWKLMIAPLPRKLWLSPEAAESWARTQMPKFDQLVGQVGAITRDRSLQSLLEKGSLTYRTYALETNRYKASAASRRLGSDAANEIRLARMSRLAWVVEAVDRQRRRAGRSSIMGEVVFDATSSDISPRPLLMRVPGAMAVFPPNPDDPVRFPVPATDRAVQSAGVVQP